MRTPSKVLIVFCAAAILLAEPLAAADRVVCPQMDQILAELKQIRKILEVQPSIRAQAEPVRINVAAASALGSKDAPFTVVEFTDYQCPFCKGFFKNTFPELKKKFIDSGEVRFYCINFPLEFHSGAVLAAQAGECANDQGQFWKMHDQMQEAPERIEIANLLGYAQEIGMNVTEFRDCVESAKYKGAIEQVAGAVRSKGVSGTPTFVIGRSTPEGVEGELVVGAVPFRVFEQRLKELRNRVF